MFTTSNMIVLLSSQSGFCPALQLMDDAELRQLPAAARVPVCADGINYLDTNTDYGPREFHLPQNWVTQHYSSFLDELARSHSRSRSITPDIHPQKARRTLAPVRAICLRWFHWSRCSVSMGVFLHSYA